MTEQASAEAGADERDYESEARKIGWVPEDEFKGDKRPAKFKSAKEFVEDGENLTPHMRRIMEAQEAKFNETIAGLRKVTDNTVAQLKSMHAAEIEQLKVQKTEAIKKGDVALVGQIDKEIEERKDATPTKQEAKNQNAEFAKANEWYGPDEELTALAVGFSQDVLVAAEKAGTPIDMEEMFARTLKKVKATAAYKAKYPDGKAAANGHAAVDGGSENPGGSTRGSPLAKLSAVERAQAKEDMKTYPKVYPSEQSWLDAYAGKKN